MVVPFLPRVESLSENISSRTKVTTLESVIDVRQGISIGPGRFGKKNKRRAWKIWKKRITVGQEKFDKLCANLCGKKS